MKNNHSTIQRLAILLLSALLVWPIIDPWLSRSAMQWHSLIYSAPGLATEMLLSLFPVNRIIETPMWVKTFVAYIPMCMLFLWPLVVLIIKPAAWESKKVRIAIFAYVPLLLAAEIAATYYIIWWVRNVD